MDGKNGRRGKIRWAELNSNSWRDDPSSLAVDAAPDGEVFDFPAGSAIGV